MTYPFRTVATLHYAPTMVQPAREPSSDAMRAFLQEAHQCATVQRDAMDEALNRFAEAAPPDCQLAVDTASLRGAGRRTVARNRMYHLGWRLAYLIATNVGDHIQAVGDVAVEPPRLFAHMTLARAALEGAARVTYLLQPAGTLPERVLRATALLVASAEDEVKAAGELSVHAGLRRAALAAASRRHTDIVRLTERADIGLKQSRRDDRVVGVFWPATPAEVTACRPNVTGLLKDLLPSKPAAYRIGSGAVHSQPWVLDDDDAFDPSSRRLRWSFDPAALAGSVDLAVSASVLTIETFAAMLGHDPDKERTAARRRERRVSSLVPPLLGH
jgi:hypothetical protein